MKARKLKVLLIEDDTIEVMKMHRALSTLKEDHSIVEANNGEMALSILEKKKISYLI